MSSDFLKKYLSELNELFDAINTKEFESLIVSLKDAYERKSQIFVFGNGGSASTASHIACDLNKGISFGRDKRFKIICLSDNMPTIMAYANDVSYDDVFVEQLKNYMAKGDLIIGISGSGNSENVIKAIRYGNENSAETFGICGFGGGKLKDIAQKSIMINSDDMQKVEDLHQIILHCAMQWLSSNCK